MNRYGYRLKRALSISLISVLYLAPQSSRAAKPYADTDGDAHTKGVTVLRVMFPSRGEVWRVRLNTSRDGEEFREAGVGLPRSYNLFRSVAYDDGNTTILVPAIAWFRTKRFFFDEPGTYWFRWRITFRDQAKSRTEYEQEDKDIEPVVIEHAVVAGTPTRSDLDFIARLSEPDLLRHLFGKDPFETSPEEFREWVLSDAGVDYRALLVIAELLKATREDEPTDAIRTRKSREDALRWAEALWDLAQEFPESSYAPYAAYYAGCCYSVVLGEAVRQVRRERGIHDHGMTREEAQLLVSAAKADENYGRADQAFAFAAEHADAYLKPRAFYLKAFVRLYAAEWVEAERLLEQAVQSVPGETTITEWVSKRRREIEQFNAEQAQPKQEENEPTD